LNSLKTCTRHIWFSLLVTGTLLFGLNCCNTVFAADQTIFIKKCGRCHHENGPAPPINPADKAGLVWSKYFKRQRHPVALQSLITATEMENILDYLQEHAADSERPVAAAIPK